MKLENLSTIKYKQYKLSATQISTRVCDNLHRIVQQAFANHHVLDRYDKRQMVK